MALDGIPENEHEIKYNERVIEGIVLTKAIEHLENFVIENMKDDIRKIATEAVKQWVTVRTNLDKGGGSSDPLHQEINYNVIFTEQIVNKLSNTININIKDTK